MNLAYYSDCLQALIESLELALDDGLNLPQNQRTELDLDHLLRMDTVTRYAAYTSAIGGGWMAPNEARHKILPLLRGAIPVTCSSNTSVSPNTTRGKCKPGGCPHDDSIDRRPPPPAH